MSPLCRRRAGGGRALLVAISGYGRSEDRARSQAAGIDLHLVKPVEPSRIREHFPGVGGGRGS
jgi:CheY-like chemotaxis protein